MITMENVCKSYRVAKRNAGFGAACKALFHREYEEIEALKDISFTIGNGEMVGYIGPNGAGKSSTIKILSGILTPDRGKVSIDGRNLWNLDKNGRNRNSRGERYRRIDHVRQIGVVFGQRSQLWWDVPVIDSYELLRDIYSIPAKVYQNNLEELTESLALTELLRTPARQLSLGQRMRCEIEASLQRFSHVKGYTFQEVLLCYSIVLMSFSLAEIWARGLEAFPGMVRRGEFDRVMLRPRSLLLQILGTQCDLERFSRVLQALAILVYAVAASRISWTPFKIATVFFMLAGGCALFSGIFLIQAALSFFFLEGLEFTNIFTFGLNEHGKYPVDIYGKGILWVLTYIIPFALVQYYPLLYVLGRREEVRYALLPFAAMLFLIPCYLLWRAGVRHYKSSGS